ncbi:hypothetical protein HZA99_01865 [Candidatus Woesearchaeota archaeon]|nr:hypothetical protein [Candidatus Woesearchaeota archaeon]
MISNATPLICLAKINQLELLRKLFTKIIIPLDVKEELFVPGKPGQHTLQEAIEKNWITLVNPVKIIVLGLGKGETAAISLAREQNDSIILDDAAAIKAAEALAIPTLRTTTVLFLAVQKKILTKKEALFFLNQLIENGYYIAPRYYALLVEKLNVKTTTNI